MNYRYSLARMFVVMVVLALLIGSARSYFPHPARNAAGLGGLDLCTLWFAAMCGLMGQSMLRTMVMTACFYAWGCLCLTLGEQSFVTPEMRAVLVLIGVAFAAWCLLDPRRLWT